jgi:hypothetical protein
MSDTENDDPQLPQEGIKFRCLSTKRDFYVKDPPMIATQTKYGLRYKYEAKSPYRTHSVRTGAELGSMFCTVPREHLRRLGK